MVCIIKHTLMVKEQNIHKITQQLSTWIVISFLRLHTIISCLLLSVLLSLFTIKIEQQKVSTRTNKEKNQFSNITIHWAVCHQLIN